MREVDIQVLNLLALFILFFLVSLVDCLSKFVVNLMDVLKVPECQVL